MILENWSMTSTASVIGEYDPPECRGMQIQGNVYDHPYYHEGEHITTSRVQEVAGHVVRTLNSVYTLGEPDPKYIEWCRQQGCHVPTPDSPIEVR